MTYVDRGALEAPWNVIQRYVLDDVQPLEYVCNENERDRVHLIGRASDQQGMKLAPELLAEYAGTYEFRNPQHPEAPGEYVVTASPAGQVILSSGISFYVLTAISQTVFVENNGFRFEFFRSDDGKVTSIFAQGPDGDIKAVRRR